MSSLKGPRETPSSAIVLSLTFPLLANNARMHRSDYITAKVFLQPTEEKQNIFSTSSFIKMKLMISNVPGAQQKGSFLTKDLRLVSSPRFARR